MADDQKPQQEMITVPVQKLVQMVAQMYGGQQAQAAGVPGQGPMQSNIQPGSFQSPGNAMLSGNTGTPPQGLAPPPPFNQQAPGAGKTNPQLTGPYALPPQGGGGPPQGSQSAPPAGGGGQPVGAPQLPQGGGGLQQAPFSGTGHPAMASPVQDYGSFLKAYPLPKAPTYEDAIGVAEELRQGQGMRGPGQGDPLGTNPALVDLVMKGMNEQYREQMGHHSSAFTGQLQAAHLHNYGLAQQEKERHDRAAEKNTADAIAGRGQTAAANQADKDRKFGSLSAAQQSRLDQHQKDQAALAERYNRAQTDKEREQVLADARKNTEDFYRSIAAKSYAGAAAGDSKATQAASDEAQKGPPSATSPGEGQPVPVKTPEDVKRMNLQSGTKIQLPDGRIGTVP